MADNIRERLPIKQSVLKKLYAYSRNACAIPSCQNPLVTSKGKTSGKIAHIHVEKRIGARFKNTMTDEEQRDIAILFLVRVNRHDEIDDKGNENDFPAEMLRKIKGDQ